MKKDKDRQTFRDFYANSGEHNSLENLWVVLYLRKKYSLSREDASELNRIIRAGASETELPQKIYDKLFDYFSSPERTGDEKMPLEVAMGKSRTNPHDWVSYVVYRDIEQKIKNKISGKD